MEYSNGYATASGAPARTRRAAAATRRTDEPAVSRDNGWRPLAPTSSGKHQLPGMRRGG